MTRQVLVVDDDPAIRELVREFLDGRELTVREAETGAEALAAVEADPPDLLLLDMWLPDTDGLDVLAALRSRPELPVVVITADSSSSRTIRAMQAGAYDYLVKPLEPEIVQHTVERALEHRRLSVEVRALQERLESVDARERIVGSSAAMQEVYKLVGRVAGSDASVLITGETGTGKELVAETLHQNSRRRKGPMVRVNCAALPEALLESELFGHEKGAFTGAVDRRKGRFELADGGTVFLDEIGEMSPSTQKKLLRVLQVGEFERVGGQVTLRSDTRVVAATNRELEADVRSGQFREDLYYRLNVIRIELPALRERRDDIPALVAHFLDKHRSARGADPTRISEAAMQAVLAEAWPGNVRQLENTIQRAVVLSGGRVILPEHLDLAHGAPRGQGPAGLEVADLVREAVPLRQVLADVERALIVEALRQAEGNRSEAARSLHVYRRLLYQKMEEYGIS
jgi:DNA-binding NtrC family response regulator